MKATNNKQREKQSSSWSNHAMTICSGLILLFLPFIITCLDFMCAQIGLRGLIPFSPQQILSYYGTAGSVIWAMYVFTREYQLRKEGKNNLNRQEALANLQNTKAQSNARFVPHN